MVRVVRPEPEVGERRGVHDSIGGPPGPEAVWRIEEWDGQAWVEIDRVIGAPARDEALARSAG